MKWLTHQTQSEEAEDSEQVAESEDEWIEQHSVCCYTCCTYTDFLLPISPPGRKTINNH